MRSFSAVLGCAECSGGEGTCDVDPSLFGASTTIWDWVNQVNAASFAGHTDWRLATVAISGDAAELETIVDVGFFPTIDPMFGPTAAGSYWSVSPLSFLPDFAWGVDFDVGSVSLTGKDGGFFVRAVR